MGLVVSVAPTGLSEAAPQLDTDESYTLEIPAAGADAATLTATLEAATVYGALRGLETFSQLVQFDFDAGQYSVRHKHPCTFWSPTRTYFTNCI